MKIMKNHIKHITTISSTITMLIFTGCGDGNNIIEGFEGNSYEEINLTKLCTTPDTIEEYMTLESGDQIVKDEEGTQVTLLHDENGVKKICLQSGAAHINRAYSE